MYQPGGQQGKTVLGLPLSGASAIPAEQFLYSQASMCVCATGTSIVSAIFTIIIYQQYKSSFENVVKNPNEGSVPNQEKQIEAFFNHIYVVGLFQLFEAVCLFSCVFAAGYYFVQNRERTGMRACCITDGFCAGYSACSVCGTCGMFLLYIAIGTALSNPKEFCAGVSTTPPPDGVTLSVPMTKECESVITGLQSPVFTSTVWFFFLSVATCVFAGLCGWGFKSSNELIQAWEDEEGGGYGGGGYDNELY